MTVDDNDLEPTAEELEAAERLRTSLESDAQATTKEASAAALLRYAKQPELDELGLKRAAAKAWQSRPARSRMIRIAIPASALAAAAAVAFAFLSWKAGHQRRSALPVPSVELVAAQASAARGDMRPLAEAMGSYRNDFYGRLARDYGANP